MKLKLSLLLTATALALSMTAHSKELPHGGEYHSPKGKGPFSFTPRKMATNLPG